MKKRNKGIKNMNIETKQAFLSSAISDISSYIHLTDTKVSIIMAVMAAIIVAITTCLEAIVYNIYCINLYSLIGILEVLFLSAFIVAFVGVFFFGLLTIRGHQSNLKCQSNWFIVKSIEEYSFEIYRKEIKQMTDNDILENMAAELYKINDINRQKLKTYKWVIICLFILIFCIVMLALLTLLEKFVEVFACL